jgi:hypothetical protein
VNGKPSRVDYRSLEELQARNDPCLKNPRIAKPNAYYLGIMKKYSEFMKSQEWYAKNKDFL